MNLEQLQFPTFRQFIWLFFMQPITLHYRLKTCGIENPGATLLALWFASDATHSIKRQYVKYLLGLLFFITPVVTVITASFTLDMYIYIFPE